MKIQFKYERKNLIWTIIMAAVAFVMFFITRYPVIVAFVFTGLYFLIKNLKISLSDRLPWLWGGIIFAIGPAVTAFCVQLVILSPEFFVRLDGREFFYNVLLVAAGYFLINVFSNRPATSAVISHILFVIFGYIDYFVYAFRQNEIAFSDIPSIGTGLSVAKNYHFALHDRGAAVILISILYIALLHKFRIRFKNRWLHRIISLAFVVALTSWVLVKTDKYETQTWELKGSYQNGFVLNFALGIRDQFISAPDGYSTEEIHKLEKQYGDGTDSVQNVKTNKDVKNPTIIAIMDESFADLDILGNLETNEDPIPFIHSLLKGADNTISGYALSSVFGAKTPNSEWEFMTGNSMAFLPAGSVVYQQYLNSQPTSIVSNLKNMGYTAVAMHPYYSTGWSRKTVYPKLGFDEQHFMDSHYFDETKILREYITDEELFEKIEKRYEESKDKDENLFIMGITMQNHGGYTNYYPGFSTDVQTSNGYFPDVNQYLTVAHQTDIAIQKMVEYFSKQDDPVEIIFFGDHQPSLDSSFYTTLNGKGMAGLTMNELEDFFKVPFFIWTNYDTDMTKYDCTSLNYLSTLALERANIELPPYNKFLADMMQYVPAINSRGYYSESLKRFAHLSDATGDEADWLQKYQALQYNNMFDKKNKSKVFFPYLKGSD